MLKIFLIYFKNLKNGTFVSVVVPQSISRPESFTNTNSNVLLLLLVLSLMLPKTISRPECFVAKVAGDYDSFEVVCFNVIFYVSAMVLFSTHFANISKLMSIGTWFLAFLHH